MTENDDETVEIGETYAGMFAAYLAEADWIGRDEAPLVFHVRRLCQQLDNALKIGAEVPAAKDSAYLQAIERLNKRRPAPTGAPAGVPGQADILDFLD